MVIHGVDFTSRPSNRKPITVASAESHRVVALRSFSSLDGFEAWLHSATGVVGIDAPFGYPIELCIDVFESRNWIEIASELSSFGPKDRIAPLAARVETFRNARPPGDKEPKRLTDRESKSASAMKFFQPPVGRMAARLLPILLRTTHNVLPVRPSSSPVTIVEIYPAKWVRENGEGAAYKDRPDSENARRALLGKTRFEFSAEIEARVLNDKQGDMMDAIIACQQVADWLESGSPMRVDDQIQLEGWII